MLEEIAVGQFEGFSVVRPLRNAKVVESLQFAAILALSTVGDEDSVDNLRDYLSRSTDPPLMRNSSLKNAFFQTSEEIYWRLQQS